MLEDRFVCFSFAVVAQLNHQLLLLCVYTALPLFLNFLFICIYVFIAQGKNRALVITDKDRVKTLLHPVACLNVVVSFHN